MLHFLVYDRQFEVDQQAGNQFVQTFFVGHYFLPFRVVFAKLVTLAYHVYGKFAYLWVGVGDEIPLGGKMFIVQVGFRFFQNPAVECIVKLKFVFFQA